MGSTGNKTSRHDVLPEKAARGNKFHVSIVCVLWDAISVSCVLIWEKIFTEGVLSLHKTAQRCNVTQRNFESIGNKNLELCSCECWKFDFAISAGSWFLMLVGLASLDRPSYRNSVRITISHFKQCTKFPTMKRSKAVQTKTSRLRHRVLLTSLVDMSSLITRGAGLAIFLRRVARLRCPCKCVNLPRGIVCSPVDGLSFFDERGDVRRNSYRSQPLQRTSSERCSLFFAII